MIQPVKELYLWKLNKKRTLKNLPMMIVTYQVSFKQQIEDDFCNNTF